ncbi:hypothetical protein JCM2811A_33910 [Methylorubrum rhodinum]
MVNGVLRRSDPDPKSRGGSRIYAPFTLIRDPVGKCRAVKWREGHDPPKSLNGGPPPRCVAGESRYKRGWDQRAACL